MTIFGSLAKPIVLKLDRADAIKPQSSTLLQLGMVWCKRRWWHTKALVPIIGIMFLTLVCLVFLQIHWFYRKLVKPFTESRNLGQEPVCISQKN